MQEKNDNLSRALDFVHLTGCNIFLTGKAGTGKTTFLQHCKTIGVKNLAVVAPTGVAAINAGGTTIHSFFQLPFAPFIPNTRKFSKNHTQDTNSADQLLGRLRLSAERREVIQKLELLIIDEISMVRCDVLDAIDLVLKYVRNNFLKPFGGVQVLLIGDLYQLPPVVKEDEWSLLSPHFQSPFFFHSKIMQENPPIYLELEKVYRQTDLTFVDLLNKIRNNKLDAEAFQLLEKRYMPNFIPKETDTYITLTTHNAKADVINQHKLENLDTDLSTFQAIIEGEFSEKAHPADQLLQLKPGAQVMFLKNDTEKIRRFYNGKIGIVEKISNEGIHIKCPQDSEPILVVRETWKNIRYVADKQTRKLNEEEIGSFTQYPLRLAWAITIHKSQGLTFERAIIDAGDAFAAGQVYVALSRCKTLEGMVLKSSIMPHSIKSDERIAQFASQKPDTVNEEKILREAKLNYIKNEIVALFDVSEIVYKMSAWLKLMQEHADDFEEGYQTSVTNIESIISTIENTASKFYRQLQQHFEDKIFIDENHPVQSRIKAASVYFMEEWVKIQEEIQHNKIITDHKTTATSVSKELTALYQDVAFKIHLLQTSANGFDIEKHQQAKTLFRMPSVKIQVYSAGKNEEEVTISHPELYKALRKKRDEICAEKNWPVYMVANSVALREMVIYLPMDLDGIKCITGFGQKRSEQFGEAFIEIIKAYCDQYALTTMIHTLKNDKPEKKKKPSKDKIIKTKDSVAPTFTKTLELHRMGKSIPEIATERNFAITTIEDHFVKFVKNGEVQLNELMSADKIRLIQEAINKLGANKLKALKEYLPDEITYSELKWVVAGQ